MQPTTLTLPTLSTSIQECLDSQDYRRALDLIEEMYLNAARSRPEELGKIGMCRTRVLSLLPTDCLERVCSRANATNRYALLVQTHLLLAARYEHQNATAQACSHYEALGAVLHPLMETPLAAGVDPRMPPDLSGLEHTSESSGDRTFDKEELSFLRHLSRKVPQLTRTELSVALHLRRNCSSKEIARSLGIAPTTVNLHRTRLRRKLGLETKMGLVQYLTAFQ
jgi:DNA-binding CsgD family transcriptional regulator